MFIYDPVPESTWDAAGVLHLIILWKVRLRDHTPLLYSVVSRNISGACTAQHLMVCFASSPIACTVLTVTVPHIP